MRLFKKMNHHTTIKKGTTAEREIERESKKYSTHFETKFLTC